MDREGSRSRPRLWVWSHNGTLKALTVGHVFGATKTASGWSVGWPVVNATDKTLRVAVRITHCNGNVEFTCPFELHRRELRDPTCRSATLGLGR